MSSFFDSIYNYFHPNSTTIPVSTAPTGYSGSWNVPCNWNNSTNTCQWGTPTPTMTTSSGTVSSLTQATCDAQFPSQESTCISNFNDLVQIPYNNSTGSNIWQVPCTWNNNACQWGTPSVLTQSTCNAQFPLTQQMCNTQFPLTQQMCNTQFPLTLNTCKSTFPNLIGMSPTVASTTIIPTSITQAPASITQAPASITQAPVSTTQTPVSTTQTLVSTTQTPASITQAPVSTTQTPILATVTTTPISNTTSVSTIAVYNQPTGMTQTNNFTCPYNGVPVMSNSANPTGYCFYQRLDSNGNNLLQIPGTSLTDVTPATTFCDKNSACVGFDTSGFTKQKLLPNAQWTTDPVKGLYAKPSAII
jgi:hypothetical protein